MRSTGDQYQLTAAQGACAAVYLRFFQHNLTVRKLDPNATLECGFTRHSEEADLTSGLGKQSSDKTTGAAGADNSNPWFIKHASGGLSGAANRPMSQKNSMHQSGYVQRGDAAQTDIMPEDTNRLKPLRRRAHRS